MAATTTYIPFPVSAAATGPMTPRSPTLSDACMILPESNGTPLRSISPNPYVDRPPSPPTLYTHSNRSERTLKLANPPGARRGRSPQFSIKSPPLSSKSSRSTIRTMVERSSRKGSPRGDDNVLASSPTIADPLTGHASGAFQQQRRLSNASSGSIHSEDLENLRWPGFDSSTNFDDSGVVMEEDDADEEEEGADGAARDEFPIDTDIEDDDHDAMDAAEKERRDAQAEDEYTSAALSRRAELILANAKKRLNVMEGNLRGARESLVVSPSPTFNSKKMQTDLQQQLAAARERDRKLYAGMGPIPPRTRPYHSSPLSAGGSPGHARGLSETSVPNPFASPTYASRALSNKRASSAMGTASGPWSPEGYGQGRFPIRESRSVEVMREPRSNGWDSHHEEQEHSLRSYESRGSRSPPNALETLPEYEDDDAVGGTPAGDDDPELRRSASAASSLRSQMQDLKGRISSLKQRAKEDTMRRRSLQNLRTPSPFTSAEIWYSGADAYKNGTSPVTADAGVGYKSSSPIRKTLYEEQGDASTTPKTKAPADTAMEVIDPLTEEEEDHLIEQMEKTTAEDYTPENAQSTRASHQKLHAVTQDGSNDEEEEDEDDEFDDDESDFVSVDGGEYDQAPESVYEDAVYEMPVTERHEDRVDAFDYEHFFLHSAMGTYSSTSRRSSSSSGDSTATTRPVTAIDTTSNGPDDKAERRISFHSRTASSDSVSTVASFATAAEDFSDEESNEQMDRFTQLLPVQQVTPQYAAAAAASHNGLASSPRTDSAVTMRKSAAATSPNGQVSPSSAVSRGSSPADLATGLQTSKIYSILLESPSSKQHDQPRLELNQEEKQLVYSLAASFQQVCTNMQSTSGDQYERKEWRRRLDEARRILNGEEDVAGEAF
ncbi:hypothetical protein BU24DRAFT_385945 [Aaosphaeria arxii CBS 175.79]|uniref:Uncharacterized protein n=1 Tax=Aaosphaeria arxii CBS 175.79 TaxID=1450172 RepID=A0A6A5Y0X5_9PLEO|nr:uncharacterized protein BU24DRAFT_385945 [Aaosphaeria arxii CBS 175.79]KAF2019122.1 hypothetical protein BU24DRAFT_385945 [Aaosphaeria arxii CBS 175.79]